MAKKLSKEEYNAKLLKANPNVILVGEYVNAKTPTLHKCIIHDVEWNMAPTNALRGCLCVFCAKEKYRKSRTKSHDDYVLEVKEKYPHVNVVGTYVGNKKAITHYCSIHDFAWDTAPLNLLSSTHGCPECARDALRMQHLKTHDEYVKELKAKNPFVEVMGRYMGTDVLTPHRCIVHDNIWITTPARVLNGMGCPICKHDKISAAQSKTHEQYVDEINALTNHVLVLEKYTNGRTPIKHYCTIHNLEFSARPNDVLRGVSCPECEILKPNHVLTKEEYETKLRDTHPSIILVGEYVNGSTPTRHRCLIDGHEWEPCPGALLHRKIGCPVCSGHLMKTDQAYAEAVKEISPHIVPLERYAGANNPILHKCTEHDVEWKATPYSILKGQGCAQCGAQKSALAHKKSHEQYVDEVNKLTNNILVLGEYNGCYNPILHKCLIHNFEWKEKPCNILQRPRCPLCSERIRRNDDIYQRELAELRPHIKVRGKYRGANTPIIHYCERHDIEWLASPSNIIYGGCECPQCGIEKASVKLGKTHAQYCNELAELNPNVVPVEEYVTAQTPILHKCLEHDFVWMITPSRALSGNGCPLCNESHGERQVRICLDKCGIKYELQKRFPDCKLIRTLPFDFYLPEYNACIEYDGTQHFQPIDHFGGQEYFDYCRTRDSVKNKYCQEKGITLLRIPYFANIEETLNDFLFNTVKILTAT